MRWPIHLKDLLRYFKEVIDMKIKLEIGGKTVIEIGWMHLIFFGVVLFIAFCLLVFQVLSL